MFNKDRRPYVLSCLIRVMKLTTFFLLITLITVNASVYSQVTKLDLKVQSLTVKEVLSRIEDQSQFFFMYNDRKIDVERKVDLDLKQAKIEDLLKTIFEGTNTKFIIKDRQIVLYNESDQEFRVLNTEAVLQQQKSVSGKVTDSSGEPLPGVSVVVKGTTNGTITDADGKYSLANIPANGSLIFSFVGMKTQEAVVGSKSAINVTLTEETIGIEEVVAIGYGTQKKSDITGSISSIKIADELDRPNSSMAQTLQGKVSGMQITNSAGGKPGATMRVRIRGTNSVYTGASPLYVVDGLAGVSIESLNPNDIESVEVLKDASSTAIYGSRGANGVIIVTTKQGADKKISITFDAYGGAQGVLKKMDLLNASEFAHYSNDVRKADGLTPLFENPDAFGKGTDWQDEIFRTAPIQNYQMTISGGSEATKYYLSGNYFGQDGVVKGSELRKGSLRLNMNSKLTDWLNMSLNMSGAETYKDDDNPDAVFVSNTISPILPVKNEDGSWGSNATLAREYNGPFYGQGNPVAMSQIDNYYRITNVRGNSAFEASIIEGLKVKVTFGTDVEYSKYYYYANDQTPIANEYSSSGGNASLSSTRYIAWQNENTISYKRIYNNIHEIDAVGGLSFWKANTETMGSSASSFVNDYFKYNNMSLGENQNPSTSSYSEQSLNSFFLRMNYGYKGKYLFTFTSRADGSSKFGKNNKYGFFPSGAIAWRVSQEPFIKQLNHISNLKLRFSVGQTGNQEIDAYSSLSKMTGYNTVIGNKRAVGIAPYSIANNDLKWEKTTQYDGGLDLGMFNERISLSLDYYYKKTTDLLMYKEIPYTSGFSSSVQNIGSVSNKGIELALTTHNIKSKNFEWTSTINFSTNKNKILDLGGVDQIITNYDWLFSNILKVGKPMGSIYSYKADGIWQKGENIANSAQPTCKPGDIKLVDLNGDKTINQEDRTIVGDPNPKYNFGFANAFRYKNFDMSIFFDAVVDFDVFKYWFVDTELGNGTTNCTRDTYFNAYTDSNPSTTTPRLGSGIDPNASSFRVADGTFLRCKNLNIGYNFNTSLLNKFNIQKLRMFMNIENLFVLTDYSGYDPEGSLFDNHNYLMGCDRNRYPQARTFTAGLSITF